MTDVLPGADWYPDPEAPTRERWWTGAEWTHHLRETPAPVIEPVQALATGSVPYAPMSNAYSSSQSQSFSQAGHWQVELGSPNTVPVWLLALYAALAVVVALLRLLLPLDVSRSLTVPIFLAVSIFYIGMAFWDHAELKRRGHDAASPAWVFLSVIAYLIARRVVLKRGGIIHNAPGNVFAGLILIGLVGSIASAVLLVMLR